MIEQDRGWAAMSDYDRIAKAISDALAAFTGNAHEPPRGSNSNSITMTKDGFITGVIRFQRLRDWVEGLAKMHRQPPSATPPANPRRV